MKTSHQFARELLMGPDLPVLVKTGWGKSDAAPFAGPAVTEGSGYDAQNGGEKFDFLEIHSAECAAQIDR